MQQFATRSGLYESISLTSIEFVYTVFLVSGMIKNIFLYFGIPTGLDFTILSFGILLILFIIDMHKNQFLVKINSYSFYSLISFLLILTMILFSWIYTKSEYYFYEKTAQFITIIGAFLLPILKKSFSIELFFKSFIIVLFILTAIYLPLFLKSYSLFTHDYKNIYSGKEMIIYQSYLIMGYLIGVALIMIFFSSYFPKVFKHGISTLFFVTLFISGARGPLIVILLIFAAWVIWRLKKESLNVIKQSFILLTLVLFFTVIFHDRINTIETINRSIERLTALSSVSNDSASNDRLERYNFVLNSFDETNIFLGHGFGSFGIEFEKVDARNYPHNIFLEFLFELGLLGLLIYSFFILIVIIKVIRIRKFLYFSLFLFLFLNSLKSLSITDSRVLFGIMSVMLAYKKQ